MMSASAMDVDAIEITPEEMQDGYSADEIFSMADCVGITFDDLITLPGFIDFGVGEVDLSTNVTRNFKLFTPLCSTPMDTVTEHDMAIGMALHGGIGFIHASCTVAQQVSMVSKVKNFENGFILEPAVMSPYNTISDLDMLRATRKISGVPITLDGKIGSKLVGIVSNRDTDFIQDRNQTLSQVMTPLEKLITGTYPITIAEANDILKVSKKGYLPIIDQSGNLRALTTRTDLKKNKAFPHASKDSQGKLLVGAAIKAYSKEHLDHYRIDTLHTAGCNIILLDSQNGDNDVQIELIKYIKSTYPDMDVMAGNVVRASQAKVLLDAGADALRVGMGVGSVATTQLVKAVGRPQLSSIYACSRLAKLYGVPIIADGGIKNTGCLIKALSVGANCVMMGSLLAGVNESPGEYYFQDGMRLKHYRGTLSIAPGQSVLSSDSKAGAGHIAVSPRGTHSDYCAGGNSESSSGSSGHHSHNGGYGTASNVSDLIRMASGVNGAVVDKGPLSRYIPFLCQSIRHGFQDMGAKSIVQLKDMLEKGDLRFELRSTSAQKEGGVHDLHSFTQRLYA